MSLKSKLQVFQLGEMPFSEIYWNFLCRLHQMEKCVFAQCLSENEIEKKKEFSQEINSL